MTEKVIYLLVAWTGALSVAVGLLAYWADGLEERIRRRFADDLRKALETERLLNNVN